MASDNSQVHFGVDWSQVEFFLASKNEDKGKGALSAFPWVPKDGIIIADIQAADGPKQPMGPLQTRNTAQGRAIAVIDHMLANKGSKRFLLGIVVEHGALPKDDKGLELPVEEAHTDKARVTCDVCVAKIVVLDMGPHVVESVFDSGFGEARHTPMPKDAVAAYWIEHPLPPHRTAFGDTFGKYIANLNPDVTDSNWMPKFDDWGRQRWQIVQEALKTPVARAVEYIRKQQEKSKKV
jgi:hypothetical protein